MPDDADRLEPILRDVVTLLRDAVRGIRALETRIDALPGPSEIGSAIGHDVREAMAEERDVVGGRLRSITDDVGFIVGRLEEIGAALSPIEGLRTEVASMVDHARASDQDSPAMTGLGQRLQSVPDALEALRARIEDLAAAPPARSADDTPAVSAAAPSPPPDELIDALRSELSATSATIGSEVQAIVSRLAEEESKRTDQLALKVTNMSMGLQQSLDTLRDRAEAMSRRATTIESENAAILEAVRTEVGRIAAAVGDQVDRVSTEVDRVAPAVAEHADLVRQAVDRVAPTVAEQIDKLRAELRATGDAIAAVAPGAPPDLAPILAEVTDATERIGERIDAAVGDLGRAMEAVAPGVGERLDAAVGDLGRAMEAVAPGVGERVDASIGSGLQRFSDAVDERLGETANRLTVRLDGVEAAVGALIVDVRRTLSEGTQATRDALEEQVGALEERAQGIGTMVEAAKEEIRGVAASTEHALRGLGTHMGSIEAAVRALPGQETAEQASRELGQIASNLNEVWMRARAIMQASEDLRSALDEQGAAVIDRLDAGVKRLDEAVVRGGATVADRVAEIEARMINALGKVELRDTTFTEVLMRLADRLPTKERSKLAERLLPWRRRADARPPSPAAASGRAEPQAPRPAAAPASSKESPATTAAATKKKSASREPKPSPKAKAAAKKKAPKKKATAKKKTPGKKKTSGKKPASRPAEEHTDRATSSPAAAPEPGQTGTKPSATPTPPRPAPEGGHAPDPPRPEGPDPGA